MDEKDRLYGDTRYLKYHVKVTDENLNLLSEGIFNLFKLLNSNTIISLPNPIQDFYPIIFLIEIKHTYEFYDKNADKSIYILKSTKEKLEKDGLKVGTKPPIPKKPLPLTPDEEKEMLELLNSMPLPKNVKLSTPDQLKKLEVGKLKDNPEFKKILSKFESQSKKSSNPYKKS